MKVQFTIILLLLSTIFLTACGPFSPTDDEIERSGYNEEGEKTCRCFTIFPTERTCKCIKEVITGEPDTKEDNK